MSDLLSLLDVRTLEDCKPRGDEAHHHLGRISGCLREEWAGKKFLLSPFDADTARKFEEGHDIENRIVTKLLRDYPDLQLGVKLVAWVNLEGLIDGRLVDEDYEPRPYEFVGHPDAVTDDAVLEIKSTEFLLDRQTWERIVPTQPQDLQWHYKMQVAAYALALCRPRCIVIQQCRVSGMESVIEFDAASMRADVIARMRAFVRVNADSPMPEPTLHESTINAKTKLSWLCKYCRFARTPAFDGCEFNRKTTPVVTGRMEVSL